MRLPITSIEWSGSLARIWPQIQPYVTQVVLPDLPMTLGVECRDDFRDKVRIQNRIRTVAVNDHSEASWIKYVQSTMEEGNDNVVVVGGNNKGNRLSTNDAIRCCRNKLSCRVWAVANPNTQDSVASVNEKLQAGATGIITQPLFSETAFFFFF